MFFEENSFSIENNLLLVNLLSKIIKLTETNIVNNYTMKAIHLNVDLNDIQDVFFNIIL